MNILIFGPNGSGKGTQGDLIKQKYNLAHIESGAIFREHIGGGTELGKKAKAYICLLYTSRRIRLARPLLTRRWICILTRWMGRKARPGAKRP